MDKSKNHLDRNRIALKPYNTTELAAIYGVSTVTFNKWIAPFKELIGKRIGNYYSIAQVKIIFDKLDLPGILEREAA